MTTETLNEKTTDGTGWLPVELKRRVMSWRVRIAVFSLMFFGVGVSLALSGNTLAAFFAAVIEMSMLHEVSCEELIETQRRYIGLLEASRRT